MKILYIDSRLSGHHISYLSCFVNNKGYDYSVMLPENKVFDEKYIKVMNGPNGLLAYLKWIKEIENVIRKEKPDIIHFLFGDDLYRYMGIGIRKINKKIPVILTCHQFRQGYLRNMCYKITLRSVKRVVVHTDYNKNFLERLNIINVSTITYPHLTTLEIRNQREAKKQLGIDNVKSKILLAIGGTRFNKGLDILLEALNYVEEEFFLIIAGKEEYFNDKYIKDAICRYRDRVLIKLHFLTDYEFDLCMNASDIVLLPYRNDFDGASGPLVEGVYLGKEIIGSNHGSLGYVINKYHLGKTFQTCNCKELAKVLNRELVVSFSTDENYTDYKKMIEPEKFRKENIKIYESVKMF